MIGNRTDHHRSRPNLGVMPDGDVAQNLRTRADHDVIPDRRMPLAFLLARAAQRHALVEQHVIADLCRLADHHAHAVIDEAAPADGRAWMDFDAGESADELRQNACRESETSLVHSMPQPVQEDCMETRVAEEDFDRALRGGVAAEDGIDLFPDGSEHGAYIRLSHRLSGCRKGCGPAGWIVEIAIAGLAWIAFCRMPPDSARSEERRVG